MKILQLFDSDNKGLGPIWNLAGLADLLQQLRYYTKFKSSIEHVVEFDCGLCGNFNSCHVSIFALEYIYTVLHEHSYWIQSGPTNRWKAPPRLRRLNALGTGSCCFCPKKFTSDIQECMSLFTLKFPKNLSWDSTVNSSLKHMYNN